MDNQEKDNEIVALGSGLNQGLGVAGPFSPTERLAVRLLLDHHADDAEALMKLDWLMREYLASDEPMTKDAEELKDMLLEIVESWLPKNLKIADA